MPIELIALADAQELEVVRKDIELLGYEKYMSVINQRLKIDVSKDRITAVFPIARDTNGRIYKNVSFIVDTYYEAEDDIYFGNGHFAVNMSRAYSEELAAATS